MTETQPAADMVPAEIARRLGMKLNSFYLRRHRYTLCNGMPRPRKRSGKQGYDRAAMEAWLAQQTIRPAAKSSDELLADLTRATAHNPTGLLPLPAGESHGQDR